MAEYLFEHNKSVGSSCTGRHIFPDIKFDLDTFYIIVEVDEHQHRGSSYNCEMKRMYDIVANLGMSCIFIRYNPDNKKSDKRILLDTINEYITKDVSKIDFDEFGLKIIYLYYT